MRKSVKVLTLAATAGFMFAGASLTADASPFVGVTAQTTTDKAATESINENSTLSGVALATANALTQETAEADDSSIVSTAKADYSDVAIAQVDGYVNVRSKADEDSDVVGKLYNNSAASVIELSGDWVKITSGSVTGYVKQEYIVVGDEELAKSVSKRLAKVTADVLYVRKEMSSDSESITQVPKDDDLVVIDESTLDQGWVKVNCEEGEGYVSTDYVTLSTSYTLAESKAEEEARLAKEEAERKAAQAQFEAAAKKAAAAAKSAAAKSSSSSSSSAASSSRSYSSASGSGGSAVVSYAEQFVGNPYVYGGSSLTNGTDCSGFVMSVYSAYGVSLPHSSSAMRSCGYEVSASEMQPGDIVCYSGHVGIYAGNGTLVHASNPSTGITTSNVNYRPIVTVRRIY